MAYDFVKENVPRFSQRMGDRVVAGSNNSVIVLGRDRESGTETGYGDRSGAGSCHIIAGRSGIGIDFVDDDSFFYASMRSDVDEYLGINDVEFNSIDIPAIAIKSSAVRIVARSNLKIHVGSAYITMTSDGRIVLDGNVELGSGAAERLVRGDRFMGLFNNHIHPSGMGPTGNPIVQMTSDFLSPNKRTE